MVVSLCDPEDYVGGYYAQPTSDAASARYASLDVGDAFCHGHDLRHGVRVLSGARYSLVLWFTPRAHRFRRRRTSTIPPWHREAADRGEADALYNVASRDASEAARTARRPRGTGRGDLRRPGPRAPRNSRNAPPTATSAPLRLEAPTRCSTWASLRYNSGDLAGAAACWREAAQRGKGNACRYYARCLMRGEGVREDRAAARAGSSAAPPRATRRVRTRSTSPANADRYLAVAAASGHAAACVDLAKTASSSREAIALRRAVHNGARRRRTAPSVDCSWARRGLVPDPSAAAAFSRGPGPHEAQACLAALYGPVPRILREVVRPAVARRGDVVALVIFYTRQGNGHLLPRGALSSIWSFAARPWSQRSRKSPVA